MTTEQNVTTVNVRIDKNTHAQLKDYCKRNHLLIGGIVDEILKNYMSDLKAEIDPNQKSTSES